MTLGDKAHQQLPYVGAAWVITYIAVLGLGN